MKINLGNQSMHQCDGAISFHADINAEELKITETPLGVRLDLGKDFSLLGEPGTPALPFRIVSIALPGDATGITVRVNAERSRKLFQKPVYIMAVPEPEVGVKGNDKADKLNKEEEERLKSILEHETKEIKNIPTPLNRFIPDAEKYNRFLAKSLPVAELSGIVAAGNNCIVHIRINPITLDKNYIPELHEHIEVTIQYNRTVSNGKDESRIYQSLPQQEQYRKGILNGLKDMVINPDDIINIHPYPWVVFEQLNYIIITDNYRWDSETKTAGDYVGDMVTEFERLALWKRQKGLKARVITITDIMSNLYGDFKTGAVDLQEVIRNFLKFAHTNWGICWCLLGGDTEIVPIRQAAGECRGTIQEGVNDPPNDNECFWTGTFMKIKAVQLGEWFSVHDSYLRLTNRNAGQLIPKKAPRFIVVTTGFNGLQHIVMETTEQFRSRLGWYFCTDATYTTYSATPTNFVRVDGAAAVIHAPLRFHYTWNTIPTDFYYSSLFGPFYGLAGRHDWDYNNNRIYGQREGNSQFDPINWNSDIAVGRAPASNPSDAAIFVRKVITYERFRGEDGRYLDPTYVDKMLLVSEDWGGKISFSATTSDPPEAGCFHTQTAQSRAIIQTRPDTNLDWNWQLITWIADNDVWTIPYNKNAAVGVRGYYFAFSPTDLRPAVISIPLPWGSIELAMITHTIVVYGSAAEIAPQRFILDPKSADGSMMDQEELRQQVDADLPVVQRFNRLYQDIDSLPLPNRLAAPVSRITDASLELALNEGQHFVSLSGHGSQFGCCKLNTSLAGSLTNNNKFFIAFADSCLTNSYEYTDSMSEALIKNPTGGAIAYVGHTRFSWIGLGDDYQRAFFRALKYTRHLGYLHRSRLNVLAGSPNDDYHKWTVLALNLLGDPEMEVYKAKPFPLKVIYRLVDQRLYLKVWNAEDLLQQELNEIKVKIFAGQREYTLMLERDGSFEMPLIWCELEDFRINVSVEGSMAETITRNDISKQLLRDQRELAGPAESKEDHSMEPSGFLKEMAPVMTAEVPVKEMQPEPQQN